MHWDVTKVLPLPDYRLCVEIADGRRGFFDVKPYLAFGIFRELRDPDYFRQVGIVFGAVTWPRHQDIAPETLLEGLEPVQADAAPSSGPVEGDPTDRSSNQGGSLHASVS